MQHPAHSNKPLAAALAAHRFGLGQARSAEVGDDAPGWLLAQLGPAEPQRGADLLNAAEGVRQYAAFVRAQRLERQVTGEPARAEPANGPGGVAMAAPAGAMSAITAMPAGTDRGNPANTPIEQQFAVHFRRMVQADVRARLATAATSSRPFSERLSLFWANHFTVSLAKPSVRGLVGAFEREAIRPHIAGRFEQMLKAAVHHAAMLRYLDNDASAGPDSPLVRRLARRSQMQDAQALGTAAEQPRRPPRITGLNENLAREVLELHTLGASHGGSVYGGWGAYGQADVTAFAAVLTGWRVPVLPPEAGADETAAARFEPAWHQPGDKQLLGQRFREGPEALDAVLQQLAVHPDTARFVSYKLARHFVADEPEPALVAQLEKAWRESGGDLPSVYRALLLTPQAWSAEQRKLKTPEEFVLSSARLLGAGEQIFERIADGGIGALGQRMQAAPSPAGWSDRSEDWLGPDAIWKRVEWATRVAERLGHRVDARALAQDSLGPLLRPDTARQLERAADGPQALALLLMAPEFQRR